MERLRSACLLAMVAFAAPVAFGQQTPPIQQQAGTVAIIGDVAHCDNYPLPVGPALTIFQAVRKAVPLSDTVQVRVIRAGHDSAQWTQTVSATSLDNGEPVTNGDVLVVQSLPPITVGVQHSAALRTDNGVLVLGLAPGVVIGDVLQQTNNLPLAEGQLKVISRFQGQKPFDRAELHLSIAHGDVISIAHDNQTALKGFGSMSPTFSEWKSTSVPVARDPFSPNGSTPGRDVAQSAQSKPEPFQFPAFPVDPLIPAVPDGTSSGSTGDTNDTGDTDAATANDNVSALRISQSEDIADDQPLKNKIRLASHEATIAPAAPLEIALDAAPNTSAALNPWNLMFIGGLLLAGTLILVGTMRSDTTDDRIIGAGTIPQRTILEAPLKQADATQSTPPVTDSNTADSKTTASTAIRETPMANPKVAETKLAAPKAEQPNVSKTSSLVSELEWFSTDWHGRAVATSASAADKSQSHSPVTFDAETAVPKAAVPKTVAPKTAIAATAMWQAARPERLITATPAAAASPADAVAETNPREIATAEAVSDSRIKESAPQPTAINEQEAINAELSLPQADRILTATENSFSDLEDLLQNRLPIDLCETQLPLRVALFGKPLGPRRLRIDAAHTAVPDPHTNLTADRRREVSVVAAACQTSEASNADETAGSLDRALHFLQERTNP